MIAAVRRHAFGLAVVTLLAAIAGTAGFLITVAGDDLGRVAQQVLHPSPSASPTPAPTPLSPMALSPIGVAVPEGSDCEGCHTTHGGIGTKPIPVLAHPLWGWRDCTACHSTASLVETAPGHTGLHKDQCLVCHQTRADAGVETAAPMRPEHMGEDRPCTACHGVDEHAPLPDSMAGRGNTCWICHNGPEFQYLFEEGAPDDDAVPAGPGASVDPASVSYRLEPAPGD